MRWGCILRFKGNWNNNYHIKWTTFIFIFHRRSLFFTLYDLKHWNYSLVNVSMHIHSVSNKYLFNFNFSGVKKYLQVFCIAVILFLLTTANQSILIKYVCKILSVFIICIALGEVFGFESRWNRINANGLKKNHIFFFFKKRQLISLWLQF